jgi:hypothetical protein
MTLKYTIGSEVERGNDFETRNELARRLFKCDLLVVFIYGSIQLRYEDLSIKTHLAIGASNKCAITVFFPADNLCTQ